MLRVDASPARWRVHTCQLINVEGLIRTELAMIRVHPVPGTATDDDVPQDQAMRLIEVGLAILAIAAAGILALVR